LRGERWNPRALYAHIAHIVPVHGAVRIDGVKERRRLSLLLLAFAGVLISHTVGYWIVSLGATVPAEAVDDHAHMTLLGWLLAPGGLMALAWLAVAGARAVGPRIVIGWPQLAALMASVLVSQEVFERLLGAGSVPAVVTEPSVWLSLVATPAVARLLVLLVGLARCVVEFLVDTRPVRSRHDLVFPCRDSLIPAADLAWSPVLARGPPS